MTVKTREAVCLALPSYSPCMWPPELGLKIVLAVTVHLYHVHGRVHEVVVEGGADREAARQLRLAQTCKPCLTMLRVEINN